MNKIAILIGLNEYNKLNPLKYARPDAEAVVSVLSEFYDFAPHEILLSTCGRQFAPLDRRDFMAKFDANLFPETLDLLVVGFWGHGVILDGKRYLCPANVGENEIRENGVALDDLAEALRLIPAKNVCLILDCCQSRISSTRDTLAPVLAVGERESFQMLARDIVMNPNSRKKKSEKVPPGRTVAILNSCSEGERAYEWDMSHHVFFTAHLLEAMRQGKNRVTDLFEYVRSRAERDARLHHIAQTPFYTCEGGADIVLPAKKSRKSTKKAAAPQPETPSSHEFESILQKTLSSLPGYDELNGAFPTVTVVPLLPALIQMSEGMTAAQVLQTLEGLWSERPVILEERRRIREEELRQKQEEERHRRNEEIWRAGVEQRKREQEEERRRKNEEIRRAGEEQRKREKEEERHRKNEEILHEFDRKRAQEEQAQKTESRPNTAEPTEEKKGSWFQHFPVKTFFLLIAIGVGIWWAFLLGNHRLIFRSILCSCATSYIYAMILMFLYAVKKRQLKVFFGRILAWEFRLCCIGTILFALRVGDGGLPPSALGWVVLSLAIVGLAIGSFAGFMRVCDDTPNPQNPESPTPQP